MDSIIRLSRRIANYTCIDNGIACDEELSLQERGLMLTVLSLPDDWEFNIRGLSKRCHESMPTIGKIIKRLIDHGYCKRRRLTDPETGRIIHWEYLFFEVKNGYGCTSEPESNIPHVENPQCGNSSSGKVAQTKYYNKPSNNKPSNKEREGSDFVPPTLDQVKQMVHDYRLSHTDPTLFWIHFSERDWKYKDGKPMKSLKRALYSWEKREQQFKSR